ncbi:MAG: FecR domain-containing protein [Verrucomicrobiales bacterium]|nr:FecR domain-containing protein [Verrucomicrobiales bacterium]
MTIRFPSKAFDDVVASVCHGEASEEQLLALRAVLIGDELARDEYVRRVSLHACLASEPDLFAGSVAQDHEHADSPCELPIGAQEPGPTPATPTPMPSVVWWWRLAFAAALAVLIGAVGWWVSHGGNHRSETSRAVAMLNRVVNARWQASDPIPKLGAPLEPGRLRLESGLVQIVFYNGARVVIEGPAEVQLVSSTEAICFQGTLTAEVPPPAIGFRVSTPQLEVTDRGTAFGLKVTGARTALHVFEGHVESRAREETKPRDLARGSGLLMEGDGSTKLIAANPAEFAALFELQARSVAAEALRYDKWRAAIRQRQRDPSLWVHLDFEHGGTPAWRLPNAGSKRQTVPDATIVGCEWQEGRWSTKPALEFRGMSDRLRLTVPGDLNSVTLAAWVRVQGLDRQINSIFMSDGFAPGTLHWVVRNDGVLGLTVIGDRGGHQIITSPPVLTIDQFGIWTHLAVTLDASARQVVHYVNGRPVSRQALRMTPPFRVGTAELGNWNAHGFPGHDPFLIRNFSGAMDEFCLFDRALTAGEVRSLYADGRPQSEILAALDHAVIPVQPQHLPNGSSLSNYP